MKIFDGVHEINLFLITFLGHFIAKACSHFLNQHTYNSRLLIARLTLSRKIVSFLYLYRKTLKLFIRNSFFSKYLNACFFFRLLDNQRSENQLRHKCNNKLTSTVLSSISGHAAHQRAGSPSPDSASIPQVTILNCKHLIQHYLTPAGKMQARRTFRQ